MDSLEQFRIINKLDHLSILDDGAAFTTNDSNNKKLPNWWYSNPLNVIIIEQDLCHMATNGQHARSEVDWQLIGHGMFLLSFMLFHARLCSRVLLSRSRYPLAYLIKKTEQLLWIVLSLSFHTMYFLVICLPGPMPFISEASHFFHISFFVKQMKQ